MRKLSNQLAAAKSANYSNELAWAQKVSKLRARVRLKKRLSHDEFHQMLICGSFRKLQSDTRKIFAWCNTRVVLRTRRYCWALRKISSERTLLLSYLCVWSERSAQCRKTKMSGSWNSKKIKILRSKTRFSFDSWLIASTQEKTKSTKLCSRTFAMRFGCGLLVTKARQAR